MFYSQFILAKKGPLGTIWIAAHLERKLRKNQVADTDIGFSVDSILFPEAPIALRLSSHLLLGVVRIYSRKVNYLFHDCSEALLKIKQAFRSTAVDLPPEESTAPYHSITLPETFDLDDFELPDNAFFNGNFVDHHISTREQITLQDTMDGLAYSTSQFGLDERFGDGDASQIGLELDEGLFLDKVPSAVHASDTLGYEEENVDLQTPGQSVTTFKDMDIDGAESSKDMPDPTFIDSNTKDPNRVDDSDCLHGGPIQPPDLNEVLPHVPIEGSSAELNVMDAVFPATRSLPTDLIESAQAPSTPVLMEEAIPANVQEGPALSFSRKTSLPNDVEGFLPNALYNSHLEFEDPNSTKLMPKENLGNQLIEPDFHVGDSHHEGGCVSLSDKIEAHSMPDVENESLLDSLQNTTITQQGDSPSTVTMPPVLSDIAQSEPGVENASPLVSLQNATIKQGDSPSAVLMDPLLSDIAQSNSSPTATLDELCSECGQENGILYNKVQNRPFDVKTLTTGELVSDGISEVEIVPCKDNSEPLACKNVDPLEALESSCPTCHPLPSGADQRLGLAGTAELGTVDPNTCSVPHHFNILNPVGENTCHSHVLRACNSTLENGHLVESAPDLSSRDVGLGTSETLGRETLHAGGASAEVQGEDHATHVMDTNSKTPQILEPASSESEIKAHLNNPEGLFSPSTKDTQLVMLNGSTSSEFPAPETVVLAPAEVPDLVDDLLVPSTANKEGEGSANRFKSLSGKKRHLMESTPVLENGDSAKLSVVRGSKRSMDYIPDDDDVLASILVGRRMPFLKMRPTPPPPKAASSKRLRMTPRVNTPKRKVLLDDTMVLHGDAIRQQLTSTEDIRRIRRKAPCTCHEIWMIQKYLLEDEIFNEPLFTGISSELTDLQNETYCASATKVSRIDANHSLSEISEDLALSRSTELVKETGIDGTRDPTTLMPKKNDIEAHELTETVVQIERHPCENPSSSLGCDAPEQIEALTDTTAMELVDSDVANQAAIIGAEMSTPASHYGDACNIDFSIEPSSMDKTKGIVETAPPKSDGSCLSPDRKSVIQPADDLLETINGTMHLSENTFVEKDASIADKTNDSAVGMVVVNDNVTMVLDEGAFIPTDTSIALETEGDISVDVGPLSFPQKCDDLEETANDKNCEAIDSFASTESANPSIPDMTVESNEPTTAVIVTNDQVMEGVSKGTSNAVVEEVVVADKVTNDGGGPSSYLFDTDGPQLASTCPLQFNTHIENVPPLGEEENPTGNREVELESAMDVEMHVVDVAACDFSNILEDNDTDFLNVDDEAEPLEEEDNNISSAKEDRFFENSGWSSRTRAVAKYLHSLFDNEAGHGRKVISVDRLLAGKSRKEASRMFFETLVLKTKDYIHVEQENPFENINIKPRVKLMKSEL
ncbi:sister chromatid cohesion 1 protein 4-like [Tasmannia lanceolata]|uniref:sister chromatid cohesion 1 protein 4-like n=1 Tax=Tasmannia lanceolata TaxID=3420 RepID=UPI004063A343